MHVAPRSYLSASVALVAATAVAVSPIAPPAFHAELPSVHAADVALSAVTDPLELWAQTLETSLANANVVGQKWLADPAPILRQVIANQLTAAANFPAIAEALAARLGELNSADPTGVPAMFAKFITDQLNGLGTLSETASSVFDQLAAMMDPADPFGIPATVQKMLDEIASGELAMGFTTFASLGVAVGFPVIMAGFPVAGVFSQPFKDLADIIDPTGVASQPLRNLANFIDRIPSVLPSLLINGLLGPVNSVGVATAAALEGVIGAVMGADPEALVSALVNAPATITNAMLNGYMAPGDFPMAGLLAGPFGVSSIGSVLDVIKSLAEAIASPSVAGMNIQSDAADSSPELSSAVASPLSSTAKTSITVDVVPNVDATTGSGSADTDGSAAGAKAADKQIAPVADNVKVSLKAEPGTIGMGTTDPGEAKAGNTVEDEAAAAVNDVTGGSNSTTATAPTTAGDGGADAGNSTTPANSGSDGM
jgi:hypothetical protein